jgi:hypothetical protein
VSSLLPGAQRLLHDPEIGVSALVTNERSQDPEAAEEVGRLGVRHC